MSKILLISEALEHLQAALDDVAGSELAPREVDEALALVRRVERAGRRIDAVRVRVIAAIDDGELHRPDGHGSSSIMVGHAANLSAPERKRRARAERALHDLPEVAAAFGAGAIGACQVDRIARVHANPRVRRRFLELDQQVALLAARLPYDELDARLTRWVLAADEDGTADRSQRNHENRDARIVDHFDMSWHLLGTFGSLTGAQMHAIHCSFIEAEFQADWGEASAIHGEATTLDHLSRTDAQRRADALTKIFLLGADAFAAAPGGSVIDTNIVIDAETFERHLRRMAGQRQPARKDLDLGPVPEAGCEPGSEGEGGAAPEPEAPPSSVGHRCSTLDGRPVDPTEVVADALVGRVRRVVLGADSVVIDLGRRQRIFTGGAQLAVQLSRSSCYWPGCNVPVSRCQSDHLLGWKGGGRTDPGNGAPACGRHNRHKEHGFTVRRDARGRLHVYRPDGTEIEQ